MESNERQRGPEAAHEPASPSPSDGAPAPAASREDDGPTWQQHVLMPLYALPLLVVVCGQGALPRRLVCEGWSEPFKLGIAVLVLGVIGWAGWEYVYFLGMKSPGIERSPKGAKRVRWAGLYILWSLGAAFVGLAAFIIYLAACR